MNARLEAKDLPCLFDSLVKSQLVLVECETKENQRRRRTSASAAAKGIMEMAKYYPELSAFLDSLENYSLCERYYNQIIVKKSCIKRVTKLDSSFLYSEEKERKKMKAL